MHDLRELYSCNSPADFWQLGPSVSDEVWLAAVHACADTLPGGAEALAQHGAEGLIEHILGEGQFGPARYRLSPVAQAYYQFRPVIPRSLTWRARRTRWKRQAKSYPLMWPIEDRYVKFLYQVRDRVLIQASASRGSGEVNQSNAPKPVSLWPDDARFAFVLSHDIERAEGQEFVRTLADLDERYGFRSAFNFVAEDYTVDFSLLAELRERGFEVGLHGLKHNGKLFWSRPVFERSAQQINRYLREWGVVGFRSPSTHRQPRWMQALDIEYDMSFFDTDPFETMRGGTMSIWPFFCGHFVELPYTLPQDHTLLVVLRQRTPRLWVDKTDFIAKWGGMALVNVHPDYMRDPASFGVYEELLQEMVGRMRKRTPGAAGMRADVHPPECWHALPFEVASWWRARLAGGAAQGSSEPAWHSGTARADPSISAAASS